MRPAFRFKTILFLFFAILIFSSCQKSTQLSKTKFQEIVSGFETPVDSNTVWCYWYWINDDISKEGITKDLLAMKEAGIGAALIGNINPAGIDGKVPMLSEDWWSHMVHAVTEGKRIGVDIGIFNCPGWSQSGGPWVSSDKAMRYLAFSETQVSGPGKVEVKLVQPKDEFQDTHVLAFASLATEKNNLSTDNTEINISPALSGAKYLLDGDRKTVCNFYKNNAEYVVEFKSDREITARSLRIIPGETTIKVNCDVMAEGENGFKKIKSFLIDRSKLTPNVGPDIYAPICQSLPNVSSTKFRLVFTMLGKVFQSNTYPNAKNSSWDLAEISISEAALLENFAEKSLGKMHPTPFPEWDTYLWEKQPDIDGSSLTLNADNVIDLSDKMDDSGLLTWDAPAGDWTIMRIGMTPTGTKNSPSAPQGQGYEIDKMNSNLVKFHFDNFVGEFLKRLPEESKSAFKYVIADSYEMGSQNWTDDYEVKFKEKYGYDPVKYLPVLSGRIVGSVEESERFLWDLRRSVADDVAYEYVGGLREASNEHNLKTWLENYGHWGFPSEFMMYGGQSNLIGGEFWNEGTLGNIECKASSSTSHTYGKGRTSAEAFTAAYKSYLRHPAYLKKRGDWSFTEGINHFVLHLYIQQPDDNRKPGMNAWFSTEFNRHNTWFGQADNYFDYLRRCQHLLQQGQYAADVCYFIGENAPIMTGGRNPEIPKGYSYDYMNGEVILDRLSVKDGKFVLPDGMSYSVMVLPPVTTMRPEILAKLEQLVQQGGVILGSQPKESPSLQNYPECDKQVQELAAKLWAADYVDGKMTNNYGEGLVLDGYELEEVLESLNLKKDVDLKEEDPVLWTHRTMPGMDIYFITNQGDDEIEIHPTFRVDKTLKPQLWDAVTGEVRSLGTFEVNENGTVVPIKLKEAQSCFIVFTGAAGIDVKGSYTTNFPEPELLQTIDQPFSVDFNNKEIGPKDELVFDSLMDWSKSDNDIIKYYSGTATYKTTFTISELPQDSEFFINLGDVSVMAEVKLNGKEVGGVWIAPYRLNISGMLQAGENELEIEVVNLWRNRLIKDKMLPEAEKYTWIVIDDIEEGEQPHSSGLIGPVRIEAVKY